MFKIAKAKLQHRKFEDDIDRAVRFAIMQVQSFSGTRNSWGYRKFDKSSRWIAFLKRLGKIRKRLERVQIECKDFKDAIETYDSENTLFYIDPPYIEKEHYYQSKFDKHEELAKLLNTIKGKFLLSYYPHKLIDEYYQGFNIIQKEVSKPSYGITKLNKGVKQRPRSMELLIKNF